MQTLIAVLVTWLSVNFGLAENAEPPRVKFVSPETMAKVRYNRLMPMPSNPAVGKLGTTSSDPSVPAVHAMYDDRTRTIYLPAGWNQSRPAEVSLLLHELVHHLQNAAGVRHDCAEAREKLAYRAQTRWLELFGTTLEAEFKLDPMTVLVRTNCFF